MRTMFSLQALIQGHYRPSSHLEDSYYPYTMEEKTTTACSSTELGRPCLLDMPFHHRRESKLAQWQRLSQILACGPIAVLLQPYLFFFSFCPGYQRAGVGPRQVCWGCREQGLYRQCLRIEASQMLQISAVEQLFPKSRADVQSAF